MIHHSATLVFFSVSRITPEMLHWHCNQRSPLKFPQKQGQRQRRLTRKPTDVDNKHIIWVVVTESGSVLLVIFTSMNEQIHSAVTGRWVRIKIDRINIQFCHSRKLILFCCWCWVVRVALRKNCDMNNAFSWKSLELKKDYIRKNTFYDTKVFCFHVESWKFFKNNTWVKLLWNENFRLHIQIGSSHF